MVRDASDTELGRGWALNECSIENVDRTQVLDATLEVDFRPVSSFGCDGVLISTPTGSTAYAFSAGGPVMWCIRDSAVCEAAGGLATLDRGGGVRTDDERRGGDHGRVPLDRHAGGFARGSHSWLATGTVGASGRPPVY